LQGKGTSGTPESTLSAEVGFRRQTCRAAIIERADLAEGSEFDGPAVVTEYSGTTVVGPGWRGRVENGHLLLTRRLAATPDA
jgi:N-methylhydantoinase A/oxoprolinase/acetone carboxylase beta subunit